MRIVVVGGFNMDFVVHVSRRPERGEALAAREFAIFPGGKGCNQAIAAARLGAHVTVVGRLGTDVFGADFLDLLAAEGIDSSFVVRDPDEGTGIGMPVVFDDGGNSIIYAPRANRRLAPADVEAASSAIAAADILLLQLEVPMAANLAAARIAAGAGVPLLLNPAPAAPLPEELLALSTLVVPNEGEAAMLVSDSLGSPHDHARALLRPGMAAVIVTLGERGAVAATIAGVTEFPAFQVEAIDTVGAGDAFCAALAVATVEKLELPEAIAFASAAAAISVTRAGAASSLPKRAEVEALLAERPPPATPLRLATPSPAKSGEGPEGEGP